MTSYIRTLLKVVKLQQVAVLWLTAGTIKVFLLNKSHFILVVEMIASAHQHDCCGCFSYWSCYSCLA